MTSRTNIMIAGIGGASLGTELLKALELAGRYNIFGCDISPLAYGLYDPLFTKTYRIPREDYANEVISVCKDSESAYVIPGGEQPMVLLGAAEEMLRRAGISLVCNNSRVIRTCSDKAETFRRLAELNVPIPRTRSITDANAILDVGLPCIVKPATGSGGSSRVFFATDADEARVYADYISRTGEEPIIQEYVAADEGEFTVGVLSLPDGSVAGSVALQRALDSKLSVGMRGRGGVISSGYSQGYIADFPNIRKQCAAIASTLGSTGPLNIQGRLRDGALVPFEINPRFSASTYLRAMAGLNEVDIYLQFLMTRERPPISQLREGWYLRSLIERFVPSERVDR